MKNCPFCKRVLEEQFATGEYWYAVFDASPAVSGHSLLIPYRHVTRIQDLNSDEWDELHSFLVSVSENLERDFGADYMLGINHGKGAGQTKEHLHIHIMPVQDMPEGGVRHAIANPVNSLPKK
jgi:diadenosine tetraphosphate (Ap4A) HIT family hydrolase